MADRVIAGARIRESNPDSANFPRRPKRLPISGSTATN
jgi:hypothetical protein